MPKAKTPPNPPKANAAKPAIPAEAAKAFAEVEPLLATLSPKELAPINTDIPRAVSIAVGAFPHIVALRADAAKLPLFEITNVDRLGTYALAAWYAHLLALPATLASQLAALLDEAKPLREAMLLSAELLAHMGYFDKNAVKAIRAGQGNLDTANDLVALAALFTSGWLQVENKSPIQWEQVEQAAQLGPRILVALGVRDQPGVKAPDPADPGERRARAYTLFVRAYHQCRRAVTYLRWDEGDADEIAPSLFANRGPRKVAEEAGEPGASEPGDAAPAETPAPAEASDK
jgi:hypothetical protein